MDRVRGKEEELEEEKEVVTLVWVVSGDAVESKAEGGDGGGAPEGGSVVEPSGSIRPWRGWWDTSGRCGAKGSIGEEHVGSGGEAEGGGRGGGLGMVGSKPAASERSLFGASGPSRRGERVADPGVVVVVVSPFWRRSSRCNPWSV